MIVIRESTASNSGRAGTRRRFVSARDLKDVPLPADPVPDPVISGISHRFTRKSDDQIELESRVEDRVFRAIVRICGRIGTTRHHDARQG